MTEEIVLRCRWCKCAPLLSVSGVIVQTVRFRCPKCGMETVLRVEAAVPPLLG